MPWLSRTILGGFTEHFYFPLWTADQLLFVFGKMNSHPWNDVKNEE
jgi:hypothetical protein